jgi:hypothetical protein
LFQGKKLIRLCTTFWQSISTYTMQYVHVYEYETVHVYREHEYIRDYCEYGYIRVSREQREYGYMQTRIILFQKKYVQKRTYVTRSRV